MHMLRLSIKCSGKIARSLCCPADLFRLRKSTVSSGFRWPGTWPHLDHAVIVRLLSQLRGPTSSSMIRRFDVKVPTDRCHLNV